ncbi:hypothetical protein [Comamonas composti]|uniref:hypothetical protein n=1 Tax=Comamonas composti TaxID=408558 RepID=UPI00146FC612|nr:hypothetical protein [Comamonas composti]
MLKKCKIALKSGLEQQIEAKKQRSSLEERFFPISIGLPVDSSCFSLVKSTPNKEQAIWQLQKKQRQPPLPPQRSALLTPLS